MNQALDAFPDKRVCVLGLGYVGLTLATVMTEVGFEVFGVEIRDDILEQLERGKPHFHEPGIEERLERAVAADRLHLSRHIPEGCPATVFIITVGTPLDTHRRVRIDMIESVSREVAEALHEGDLVVMRSTVKIGTTQSVVLPALKASGKSFDLAFCPERTLEGKALEELRRLPQIVAGQTESANIRAAQLFQLITPTVVRVSSIETAEMIKMVDNAQRDVQFAYANEVARLCDAVGVSAAEVIEAGKLGYPRTNLPMPGPVGGPCLEKDPYILAESLEPFGIDPEITMAARRLNERQPHEVAAYLSSTAQRIGIAKEPVISLLGIAFKGRPETDDLRGTMAIPIHAAVKELFPDAYFRGFDPIVSPQDVKELGFDPAATIEDAFSGAHLVLILNNHPFFGSMLVSELAEKMERPSLVYDFWNHFTTANPLMPRGVGYAALGSHGTALLPDVKD